MMTKKKKILVLCGMFVLLVATAVLNFLITQQQSPAADDGQDVLASANFFTQFRSVRTSNRNEEVLYLDSIIETTAAEFEEARQTAMDEKLALVANMELELTLEGLIKAKGFEDVVVVVGAETEQIIVMAKMPELTAENAAIIYNVVYEQAQKAPEKVKIVPIE